MTTVIIPTHERIESDSDARFTPLTEQLFMPDLNYVCDDNMAGEIKIMKSLAKPLCTKQWINFSDETHPSPLAVLGMYRKNEEHCQWMYKMIHFILRQGANPNLIDEYTGERVFKLVFATDEYDRSDFKDEGAFDAVFKPYFRMLDCFFVHGFKIRKEEVKWIRSNLEDLCEPVGGDRNTSYNIINLAEEKYKAQERLERRKRKIAFVQASRRKKSRAMKLPKVIVLKIISYL